MAEVKTFDLDAIYKPLPQQARFHASPAKFRLLGGAVGGGKTYAIVMEALLRCLHYDFPLTGAIFRKSFPELESTIIRTYQDILPEWFYKYNQTQHVMRLATGDRLEFCYAENNNDVIRYQSRQWDFIGIDELTHFSEFQFSYLISRLRTTKPINTKFFAGTNPGGVGHKWVKSRWISKDCESQGYKKDEYEFIPAGLKDNPYIMKANPDYIDNLMNLPENERRALLEGDWDVFEGQFFSEFDRAKHVVRPFDIPEDWTLIMGWDEGTNAPRSVHIYAVDHDSRVWVVYEYYRDKENLREAAMNIRDELRANKLWGKIFKCVVDPAMKRKSNQTGMSSISILEGMGFGFKNGEIEPGNNDRQEGWRVMKSYLSYKPYEEPLLKIFSTCENMIRTLPELVYYKKRTGESKKDDLDTTQEDHAADECRYVLMSLDKLPSRFQGIHAGMKIVSTSYVPNSSLRGT